MTYRELYEQIVAKQSFLCVGLDPDIALLPESLSDSQLPLYEFNKRVIDATAPYAVAFKLNSAFYEALGAEGYKQMQLSVAYIKERYPQLFVIADAKRGDIGNTAHQYAKAFFSAMQCDAVTLSPYMGGDSIKPFLEHEGKWAIILTLTSNPSATELEMSGGDDSPLYERVIKLSEGWGTKENIMFVVGATRPQLIERIRGMAPQHFFLVPGVGAQGGSVEEVARSGMNSSCGLLVNSSRGIIYASRGDDFADAAGGRAKEIATVMKSYIKI